MGANHYKDPSFMTKYIQLEEDFKREVPLFDVKDIAFPLSTRGMMIVDKTGRRVKLAGGNWSGGHAQRECVGGLDKRPLQDLVKDIKNKFGMNVIRLTFSLQLFRDNRVIDNNLIKANPQLYGKTAIQIFDQTIKAITNEGLMIYLNNHTSKSQWCCTDNDGDGLWFNKEYPELLFYEIMEMITKRYKDNPRIIGMDLRNEIRSSSEGKPTWGDGSKTDWKLAAETIGNKILKIAPHWLIIVGGLQYQLDLTGVKDNPVKLDIPSKLVYSGHFYGFSWATDHVWKFMSEDWFKEKLFNDQLYVRGLDLGHPFIFGQFGNNNRDDSWKYMIRLLKQRDIDWTYWCLDGYKCHDAQDQTFGVWDYQFKEPRHPDLLEDLKSIAKPFRGINL